MQNTDGKYEMETSLNFIGTDNAVFINSSRKMYVYNYSIIKMYKTKLCNMQYRYIIIMICIFFLTV